MKTCARCGRRFRSSELRIYSKWTRNYYCFDMDACAKRAKRARGRNAGPSDAQSLLS